MKNNSSKDTDSIPESELGRTLALSVPVRGEELFKHNASPPILNFLADNPGVNVSIRQLSRVTPVTERATREAVDALEANGLVETFHEGNARRVHVNRARLTDPGDPIHSIPQVSYRTPVRVAYRYLLDELESVLGVVLFGSVARGEADRQSDIDLWVLVGDDLFEQRNRAGKLSRDLEDLQIPPTIALEEARDADFASNWPAIRTRLENDDGEWASADRHSFEFVVETPPSILQQSARVDPSQLFGEGITLQTSETLERVKREVMRDE